MLVADLAPEVGVVREGELDGGDLPRRAVHEERIRPEERGFVRNGRGGAEGPLAVNALAP